VVSKFIVSFGDGTIQIHCTMWEELIFEGMIVNVNVSLSLTLSKNEKVEYHMRIKTINSLL